MVEIGFLICENDIVIIERFPDIQNLSALEKEELALELFASSNSTSDEVDPVIIAELNRRMKEFEEHPDRVVTWESVRDKLLKKAS